MNSSRTLSDHSVGRRRVGWAEFSSAVKLPGQWTGWLLAAIVAISTASLLTQIVKNGLEVTFRGLPTLERWLYVDREMGIPAWFSSILLFLCGQALWQVATASRRAGDRWHRHWRFLSVIFVYLSLDELTEIHEQSITPLKTLLDLDGALRFAWVVAALPILALLGLFYLRFLLALPKPSRFAFLLAAGMYVGGAAGVELIGSALHSGSGTETLAYAASVTAEEGLEMLGVVLFLGAVTAVLRGTGRPAGEHLPFPNTVIHDESTTRGGMIPHQGTATNDDDPAGTRKVAAPRR